MITDTMVRKLFTAMLLFTLAGLPQMSFAQMVPVIDRTLITAFNLYVKQFTSHASSVDSHFTATRDIITGADPQGASKAVCHQGKTPQPARAYPPKAPGDNQVAWYNASEKVITTSNIPIEITTPSNAASGYVAQSGFVAVNDSASLRCLLQELVEWEKLGLSVQIHSMLKTYVADAQAKQLKNQLVGKISSANQTWGKQGNMVLRNGITSTEPVYTINASQSIYDVKKAQLDHLTLKGINDPNSGSPVGSLAICAPWAPDTMANMVRNNRNKVEDPSDSESTVSGCNLPGIIDPNDFGKFSASFNDPSSIQGGLTTFAHLVSNPQDSPLGAIMVADSLADGRLARQEQTKRDEFANTGARAQKECSGGVDDPYCLDTLATAVTPQYLTAENQKTAMNSSLEAVMDGDTLDGMGLQGQEEQAAMLTKNAGGYLGNDTTNIATSKTAVNDLVREFYDVIEIGYFGIQENTIDWAQATMLMIYDEMKFDPANPNTAVTDGATYIPIDA